MLLNVGDSYTTMWAIAVCVVSDLFSRCFLIDIDTWLLQKLDRENIENKNSAHAKIRQTAWACELNLLSTMETTAIISAAVCFIILKPQMTALDIGYSITEDISTSILFANLLLQLFAETVVTIISGWWNKQRGVPVMTFFSMISSNAVIFFLAFYGVGNVLLVLYGLVRHPTILACASPNSCDCLHIESIKTFYQIPCAGVSSIPQNITTYRDDGLFQGVDTSILGISLLTGFGIFAVIGLSVLIARNRRQTKVLADLEHKAEAMKNDFSEKMQKLVDEEMEKQQTKEMWKLLEAYAVPRDHVTLENQIGTGAMGAVWRGVCRGKQVAVKQLHSKDISQITAAAFRKECNLMALLQKGGMSHPNLVQMLFCCWDRELLLMLEYCELGSLENLYILAMETPESSVSRALTWRREADKSGGVLKTLARHVACGMDYMHSRNPVIIHRDLKPGNILIRGDVTMSPSEWSANIADFGLSREYKEGDNLTMVGTPYFCCPEIIMCEEYDETADAYSFGILLYDMLTFRNGGIRGARWGGKRYSQVNVVKGFRPQLPDNTAPWLQEMIKSCWSVRPSERPSFKSMVATFGESDAALVAHAEAHDSKTMKRKHTFQGDAFENLQPQSVPQHNVEDELIGERNSNTDSKYSKNGDAISLNENPSTGQSASVKRSLLLFKMLGYAITLSIVAIVILAIWSNVAVLLTDTYVLSSGVVIEHFPVLDTSKDFVNFILTFMIAYGLATFANIASHDKKMYPDAGPKYAIVPLCLTVIMPLIFYCIAYNVVPFEVNARYIMLNIIVYMLIYVILFIILDISLRAKWHQMDTKSPDCKGDEMSDKEERAGVPNYNGRSTICATIVSMSVYILNIGFCLDT